MTMAYSQSDIDALKAAIATGATLVKFGAGADSREVRYRSLAEMQATLDMMESEVSPGLAAPRTSYVAHSRD
jgi:hypothetical protein